MKLGDLPNVLARVKVPAHLEWALRLVKDIILGVLGGFFAGATVGLAEAGFHIATSGAPDGLAPLYALVLYGLIGSGLGFGGGVVGSMASRWRTEARGLGWGFGAAAAFSALSGFVLLYMVNKVVYAEKGIEVPGYLGIAAFIGVVDLTLLAMSILSYNSEGKTKLPGRAMGLVGVFAVLSGLFAVLGGSEDPRDQFAANKPVPAGMDDKPNTLIIMVDTLRADYLGTYGKDGDISPGIDAFAKEGVVFEQAIAGSSWTRPSGASLMTGRLPSGHGAITKASRMSDEVHTCFEVQHEAGVTTGALINNINLTQSFNFNQGFDSFVYESPAYPFGATESVFGLTWYKVVHKVREKLLGAHKVVEEFYQPAEVVLKDARRFIRDNRAGRWSLMVHLMEPHDPYFEHPYLMGTSDAEFNGVGFARAEVEHPDPNKADYLKHVYAQEITHMDRRLSDFFSWMKAEGLYDDTLILFTSDHGEEFNEHGGWWHGTTLYDEQVRVPLIAKYPNGEYAGARVPWQVRQYDACVTAVVAQGLKAHPTWDGQDLTPLLRAQADAAAVDHASADHDLSDAVDGGEEEESVETVPETVDPCDERTNPLSRPALSEIDFEGNIVTSLRKDGWKVIKASEGNPRGQPTDMLFDVVADPRETKNLFGSSDKTCGEYASDRGTGLGQEMGDVLKALKAGGAQAGEADMSDADKASLCALGYLSGEDCEK